MTKYLLYSLVFISVLLYGVGNEAVYANKKNLPQPLEEFLPSIGYKTVESALQEFELLYHQQLKLPLRVPPISFTHHFGRFNENSYFEVTMIHEDLPQNHYKIDVRPLEEKISFGKYSSSIFQLNNGNIALYIDQAQIGFNMLVIERENWQYVFSIDKDVADKVSPAILVQIANSIDY
ncbi:hypothetical protein ACIQXI_05420 [Lysinibacillus sp. NPDC097195]|uniref:hypothetical protein n=1 Tax=Lysinibacillus sp. NPDC097195 TaxID=3364141 RepID=UPI003814DEF1